MGRCCAGNAAERIGAIQLDETGKVLKYNRYDSELTQLDTKDVIGKNLFRDLAEYAGMHEFFERFCEAVAAKKLCETFEFDLASEAQPRHALVTMLYSEKTDSVWVFLRPVQEKER